MKKIFVLFSFFFFFFSSSSVFAQETWMDSATCEASGGECNLHFDTCETNQTAIGRCDNWGPDDGACCKMKDNGPVDLSSHGIDIEKALATGTVPIIGQTKCEASKASGGWGGACKGSCNDSGNDAEDFVGLCTPPGMVGSGENCCVAKGTAIKNPTSDQYETIGMTEAACGSVYDGKCEDIDSTGWDPTGGFIDGKDPTCDTDGEIVVGLCRGSVGGDYDNGCCVPKDGQYCKKLQSQKGYDVCGTMGAGGLAESITYGDYELLEQIPGSSNTSGQLQPYLESIYKAGFVLIVIGAIFMIGFGGFTYMASAGNTSMIKKGKGMITDAIIGLVVALLIWLILNIINPDLVNLKIDPLPGLSFDPGGLGAQMAASNSGTAISSLSAQEAAKKLLASSNVTAPSTYLFSTSCTEKTTTTTKANLQQVADGKGMARCSCGGGGNVAPSETLLNSLVDLANTGTKFQINILAGACHSGSSSNHYNGTAADIQRTSALDTFFSKYPKTTCQGNKTGYKVSGVVVCFEDKGHYHVSPTGN